MTDAERIPSPNRWTWFGVALLFWVVLAGLIWDLVNPVAGIGVAIAGSVQVIAVLIRALRGSPAGPTPPKNPTA